MAQRVIGPFNWTATSVPDPETLWVSRFVEGTVLVLNPETLQTVDTVRLSFGVPGHHNHDRGTQARAQAAAKDSLDANAVLQLALTAS